jgi:CheY-like chemotaxis protein
MAKQVELLLVEDSPSDIRLTQEALKESKLNHRLSVVHDGEEAMQLLNKLRDAASQPLPDLILLDLNMPKKNGHEVLAEMRKDPKLSRIPVVLLTVSQRDEDVLKALSLKMNYYLNKPVDAEKLTTLVNIIFELMSEEENWEPQERGNEDIHVRCVLASNPHTSEAVLKRLASEKHERIRSRVAENPNTSQETLQMLSKDSISDVRLSVAENPKTPVSILETLAHDENEDVRLGLAENPKTPKHILQTLSADENMYVSSRASKSLSG